MKKLLLPLFASLLVYSSHGQQATPSPSNPAASDSNEADNTKGNSSEQNKSTETAEKQSNSKDDLALTQKIRQAVMIGALAMPGLGPFIAAGPIMAALSGGAIGAVGGGLTGALVGLGIPEYEAKRYEGKVKEGGILISVHSDSNDETKRAKDIFKESGAHDISSTGEAHSDLKPGEGSETADTRVRDVIPGSGLSESDTPSPRDPILRETDRDL
jgi:hypothetical protein